jgi:thiamine-phosphate pyrophosphorylase
MLRYAITSRALYPGDEREKQAALLREVSRWVANGIDFIQLREKDLAAKNLAALARKIRDIAAMSSTKILMNSRADIAIATGCHGVHLTAAPGELTPAQVRSVFSAANMASPIVSVSCHTLEDIQRAREGAAEAILFAPVFEKALGEHESIRGQGLDQLRAACVAASPVPVYALGGVTHENADLCMEAGAAGIAGIRLFHKG